MQYSAPLHGDILFTEPVFDGFCVFHEGSLDPRHCLVFSSLNHSHATTFVSITTYGRLPVCLSLRRVAEVPSKIFQNILSQQWQKQLVVESVDGKMVVVFISSQGSTRPM